MREVTPEDCLVSLRGIERCVASCAYVMETSTAPSHLGDTLYTASHLVAGRKNETGKYWGTNMQL